MDPDRLVDFVNMWLGGPGALKICLNVELIINLHSCLVWDVYSVYMYIDPPTPPSPSPYSSGVRRLHVFGEVPAVPGGLHHQRGAACLRRHQLCLGRNWAAEPTVLVRVPNALCQL